MELVFKVPVTLHETYLLPKEFSTKESNWNKQCESKHNINAMKFGLEDTIHLTLYALIYLP